MKWTGKVSVITINEGICVNISYMIKQLFHVYLRAAPTSSWTDHLTEIDFSETMKIKFNGYLSHSINIHFNTEWVCTTVIMFPSRFQLNRHNKMSNHHYEGVSTIVSVSSLRRTTDYNQVRIEVYFINVCSSVVKENTSVDNRICLNTKL